MMNLCLIDLTHHTFDIRGNRVFTGVSSVEHAIVEYTSSTPSIRCSYIVWNNKCNEFFICTKKDVLTKKYIDISQLSKGSISSYREIISTKLKLLLANNIQLFVFGQPWISNDKQLSCTINFVDNYNIKLMPLVHDTLYISSEVKPIDWQQKKSRLISLLQSSTKVLVTNDKTKKDISKLIKSQRVSIQQFNLGLVKHFPPPSNTLDSKPFVLYVSSINERKNHMMLVKAWIRAKRADTLKNTKLIFVGKFSESHTASYRQKLELRLIKYNIQIDSSADDKKLAEYYQKCLFTVYPSLDEGWGIPPLESLAFGKICLVSDTTPSIQYTTSNLLIKLSSTNSNQWTRQMLQNAQRQGKF